MSRSLKKSKKYHFLYKIINIITQKYYIGMHSTNNLDDGYMGSGTRLRYSINKYGKENHTMEILEFFSTREELCKREEEMITITEVTEKNCMNMKIGGQYSSGMLGKKHSIETREKMSIKGKGRIFSDAHKLALKESRKKQTFTDETLKKKSDSMKGNKNGLGYKPTDESNKARSLKVKGRKQETIICPYCQATGGISAMKRHHFENCKNNKT